MQAKGMRHARQVDLVCLVDLVHLVSFVQPNKRDKPNNVLLLLPEKLMW
jgi:hypothetical protein